MVLWEMVDVTVEQKHKNRKAKDEEFREMMNRNQTMEEYLYEQSPEEEDDCSKKKKRTHFYSEDYI